MRTRTWDSPASPSASSLGAVRSSSPPAGTWSSTPLPSALIGVFRTTKSASGRATVPLRLVIATDTNSQGSEGKLMLNLMWTRWSAAETVSLLARTAGMPTVRCLLTSIPKRRVIATAATMNMLTPSSVATALAPRRPFLCSSTDLDFELAAISQALDE